jgi:hypothetical protein
MLDHAAIDHGHAGSRQVLGDLMCAGGLAMMYHAMNWIIAVKVRTATDGSEPSVHRHPVYFTGDSLYRVALS